LSLVSLAAHAQEVVHALTGTVNHIDPATKTITVLTDDGSDGTFRDMTVARTSINFDKNIRNESVAADDFKSNGARVIVYYYGLGENRTVVALRDLGPGPITTSTGTLVKFDKGAHTISIQDASGVVESFVITHDTVADTDGGAAGGMKFDGAKGQHVRVTTSEVNGSKAALFITVT
jgi:hypothetical protein